LEDDENFGLIKSNKISPIVKNPVINEPPTTVPKCFVNKIFNGSKNESLVP
jgi:hypothetical protein